MRAKCLVDGAFRVPVGGVGQIKIVCNLVGQLDTCYKTDIYRLNAY